MTKEMIIDIEKLSNEARQEILRQIKNYVEASYDLGLIENNNYTFDVRAKINVKGK